MNKVTTLLAAVLVSSSLSACQISPITRPTIPTSSSMPASYWGLISSPQPDSEVQGQVEIMGSANTESFWKYELFYKLESQGDDTYQYFDGATTPIDDGVLGIWNTGELAPGQYDLRMRVVKKDGNYAEMYVGNLTVK